MNRAELLLVRGMEECDEVSQRISKALNFGLDQIQQAADDKPEQNPEKLNNHERIVREFEDLVATLDMSGLLLVRYVGSSVFVELNRARIEAKKAKVEKYLKLSKQEGRLTE